MNSIPVHSPVTLAYYPYLGPVHSVSCSQHHRNVFLAAGADTIRLYNILQVRNNGIACGYIVMHYTLKYITQTSDANSSRFVIIPCSINTQSLSLTLTITLNLIVPLSTEVLVRDWSRDQSCVSVEHRLITARADNPRWDGWSKQLKLNCIFVIFSQLTPSLTIEPSRDYLYSIRWSCTRSVVFAVTCAKGKILLYDLKVG